MANRAAKPGDLVLVDWVDSGSAAGWLSLEQIERLPTFCRSVGWLQKRNRLGLYLAACVNDCETMNRSEASFIPAGCVQKIAVLRRAKS